MPNRSLLVGLALATLLVGAQWALAADYLENFNTGLGGWGVLPDTLGSGTAVYRSTGGVADSGYLEGSRGPNRFGLSPNFAQVDGAAVANSTGNLEALYGNLIEISYFAKAISGVDVPRGPSHLFYKEGFTTGWQKQVAPSLAPFLSNWTEISFQINTNWTDAEAMANGWQRVVGTESWSDTLHNTERMHPFYAISSGGDNAPEVVAGLDDFRMSSVPGCPCDLFAASDFAPPMGKKKKLGSTLPVKFKLFYDGTEVTSEEQLNAILTDNGCEAACPQIRIYDVSDVMEVELPEDTIDDNVGDASVGDCFRFSDGNWIFNLRLGLAFRSGGEYLVEVVIGDCELTPGNSLFEIK